MDRDEVAPHSFKLRLEALHSLILVLLAAPCYAAPVQVGGRASRCWSGCRGRVALQCAAQAPPHPATLTCRACRCKVCLDVNHHAVSGAGGSGWRWTGGRPAPPAAARSSLMTALQPARGCARRRSSGRRHTPRKGERRSPHCEQLRRDLWTLMRGRGHWVRCLASSGVRLSAVCQRHSLLCPC